MSELTTYKQGNKHGLSTPHKYPSSQTDQVNVLNILSQQLYPTGRAWYMNEDSDLLKLHEAIDLFLSNVVNDAKLTLDRIFPDNSNFTKEDAAFLEFKLGLITNNDLDLELRKLGIKRKIGYPNNIKARQHPSFIESQLRLAGFDVRVYENEIPYKTPIEINSVSLSDVQHGVPTQHGTGTTHGGGSFDLIANSIEQSESYNIGGAQNLWATFFIGGQQLGDTAQVPLTRLKEFKELVIKLKPAHTVAFTFINYN